MVIFVIVDKKLRRKDEKKCQQHQVRVILVSEKQPIFSDWLERKQKGVLSGSKN